MHGTARSMQHPCMIYRRQGLEVRLSLHGESSTSTAEPEASLVARAGAARLSRGHHHIREERARIGISFYDYVRMRRGFGGQRRMHSNIHTYIHTYIDVQTGSCIASVGLAQACPNNSRTTWTEKVPKCFYLTCK